MWKALSRSVCEVVERRVGFTAFRSDVSNRSRPDPARGRQSCHGQISNFIPQLKTYCPLKHLRSFKHKETSHEQAREKHQQKNKHHTRWNDPPINACLGAMGWSTALVLGWYLSHPLGRRIFGDSHFREVRVLSPRHFSIGQTVDAQSPIQPFSIRPLSYSSSIEEKSSSTSFHSSFTSSSSENDDVFAHQRGPFTPQEALNEVSRVFEAASRALSGDVENKLGMVCMQKGQHTEAMKHFRRASHHEHAVAAYNLGQCYELGLGTPQNLRKAAKWYKIGSDRGHPTAMYNLAVFLANGWGGLCEDQNRARELLVMAASLGLQEAKDALRIIERGHPHQSSVEYTKTQDSTEEFLEMIGASARKDKETQGGVSVRFQEPFAYLSHLDWLDLSSSSSSPNSSEDLVENTEESDLYSSLCLENEWSFSSNNHGRVRKIRDANGDTYYHIVNCNSGSESLDEAANLHPSNKPTDEV
ncbi:DAP3-binding cell death enhancer 1 [Frankliniella fusca]|uniref:DAP3-binding cell death enhancer 1 n=1 Tax=Frankliniella fusca TaxID=407009 RepID=A0AAE1LAY9_9NEOP|nr:DAP3-binding cell death enhancer 1 [Frankliniella fusca]